MPEITLYTTRHCAECQQAKKFLSSHRVEYTEVDVTDDIAKQQEMIILTGGHRRVPVIAVHSAQGNPEVLLGFDREALQKLLSL